MRHLNLAILILLVVGCTTKLTNEQRVLWSLNIYTSTYNQYLDQILDPDVKPERRAILSAEPSLIADDDLRDGITEEEWEILRVKKDILVDMKPLVLAAARYLDLGQVPPAEIQNDLTALVNKIIALAGD
jgi:hypothetical protein